MHNYKFLTFEDFKEQKLKTMIQNIIDEWKHPLYEIYTMSTGTLLNNEIGYADEDMYKDTLEKTNCKIKKLIMSIHTFNTIDIDIIFNHNFNLNSCILQNKDFNKYKYYF